MTNYTTINGASQRNDLLTLSSTAEATAEAQREAQESWQDDFIPDEHKEKVRRSTQCIRHWLENIAQHIFEVGKELNMVKELLGHGLFGRWLDINFPGSRRLAQHWMRVYRRLGTQKNIFAKLPPTALYYLAMPSTPETAISAVAQRIGPNRALSLQNVKDIIQANKGESEDSDIDIDGDEPLRASIHSMDKAVEQLDKALNKALRALGDKAAQNCRYVLGSSGVVQFHGIKAAIEVLRSQINSEVSEKSNVQTDEADLNSPSHEDWTVVNEQQILKEISGVVTRQVSDRKSADGNTNLCGKVVVGSIVVFVEVSSGLQEQYRLIEGPGDPGKGCISIQSNIGKALLHKKVGDTVTVVNGDNCETRYSIAQINPLWVYRGSQENLSG